MSETGCARKLQFSDWLGYRGNREGKYRGKIKPFDSLQNWINRGMIRGNREGNRKIKSCCWNIISFKFCTSLDLDMIWGNREGKYRRKILLFQNILYSYKFCDTALWTFWTSTYIIYDLTFTARSKKFISEN